MSGVEATVADSSMTFSRHTHDQFGIGLMERGGHRSSSGRGTVEAWPGDVITVNSGEVHDGAPIDSAPRAWRMLYLEPAVIADAAEDIGESPGWAICSTWPGRPCANGEGWHPLDHARSL